MRYPECPDCLKGTVWEINDSGVRFYVLSVEGRYAHVENIGHRDGRDVRSNNRRILHEALRSSNAAHGYTQVRP